MEFRFFPLSFRVLGLAATKRMDGKTSNVVEFLPILFLVDILLLVVVLFFRRSFVRSFVHVVRRRRRRIYYYLVPYPGTGTWYVSYCTVS